MPFTPFHWGPSSWIGLVLFKVFDFPTLMAASVIVDIEPFTVLLFELDYPLHGFFHTILGGSILAILTALILYLLRSRIRRLMAFFKLAQNSSFKKIIWSSFFGLFSHLLLDSLTHWDLEPFYPFGGNPLYGLFSEFQVYLFCGISLLAGVLFYSVVIFKKKC